MVLFHNINLKARVEVLWRGDISEGTVKYTGVLVAREGEWVGVELDHQVCGGNNGLFRGVQYFSCRPGHGIFTRAQNIRFKQNKRTLFNSYRTVSHASSVESTLFGSRVGFLDAPSEKEQDPPTVTSTYLEQLFNKDSVKKDLWSNQKGFHKSHLVGNHIRPATASSSDVHRSYKPQYKHPFITPASITATHVPKPTLKRMIEQDYFGTTIPRYTSLS